MAEVAAVVDLKGVHSAVYDVTGVEPVRLRAQLSVRWRLSGSFDRCEIAANSDPRRIGLQPRWTHAL